MARARATEGSPFRNHIHRLLVIRCMSFLGEQPLARSAGDGGFGVSSKFNEWHSFRTLRPEVNPGFAVS
jgi:hypothetical protein